MKEMKGNCSFCSLACPLVLRGGERGPIFTNDGLISLDWDSSEGSKFGGSLCARGNAVVEFISHPKRLNYPYVLGERSTFEAAVKEAAKNLSAIKRESGVDSIGILVGDNLTNEEAALAKRFSTDVLGNDNIALFAPDDVPIFRAHVECDLSGLRAAGSKPSGDKRIAFVIGDPMAEHPCTAKLILEAKQASRDSEVIVVSPDKNHSAWFANRHLRCKPGGEAAVAAGMLKAAAEKSGASLTPELKDLVEGMGWNEIERIGGVKRDALDGAAASMLQAARVDTYVSNIFGRFGAPALTALFAEAVTKICPGKTEFVPQFVQQNTWGIYSALGGGGNGKVLGMLAGAELKALILLGLDLFSAYPAAPVEKTLREKKFTVATQFFWNQTASRASVVIPAAGLMEKRGTVSPAFGEDLVRGEVPSPPGGTYTDERFLIALAGEMGVELRPEGGARRGDSGGGKCRDLSEDWAAYASSMGQLDSAETVLIPLSQPVHVADGSLSRYFHWPQITCPEPVLGMSKELAAEMKIERGDEVTVSSDGGELGLSVEISDKLQGKIVGATIHFPAVRKLFPWKLDERNGEISVAPIPVTISRRGEKG